MDDTLVVYEKLEKRIKKGDLDALLARWEFGRQLLDERGDAKQLPDGRIVQLSNVLETSGTELYNRMQFAEEYETEEKVQAAFTKHGSWYAICRGGLGDRIPRDEFHDEDDVGIALRLLHKSVGRYLDGGYHEDLYLGVICDDRTLHAYEVEGVRENFFALRHRVNAGIQRLTERMAADPDEAARNVRERKEWTTLDGFVEKLDRHKLRMAARQSPARKRAKTATTS